MGTREEVFIRRLFYLALVISQPLIVRRLRQLAFVVRNDVLLICRPGKEAPFMTRPTLKSAWRDARGPSGNGGPGPRKTGLAPSSPLPVGKLSWLLGILFVSSACATFHSADLREPARSALAAPSPAKLEVAAESLKHPYLKPLELDFEDDLSPDEAAVVAVLANPDLKALRAQRGLADAQVLAAGILPNPQLSLGASLPHGDPTAVTGTAFSLGLDLTAILTRGARRRSARFSREQVDLDVAWQEWQVAQAARLTAYRRFFLEAQVHLAREREGTLGESLAVTQAAADLRLVTEVERAAAEAAFNEARALRLQAESQAEASRLELLRLLGFPPETSLEVQVPPGADGPKPLPMDIGDEAFLAGIEARRLDLAALRLGYESQEEKVRAAVRSQFPAITVDLGHAKDTGAVKTLEPAVTLELPIFDRRQGEIAAEEASREMLRQEYAARLFSARAEVAELTAAQRQLERQLEQSGAVVAARRKVVESYGQALRFGGADVLTFHGSQIDLLGSELDELALRQSLAEVRIALATVLGVYEPGLAETAPEEP
ncbi:MAG: TolC family protein [Acidobacteria bacterium]|nr:TolC family protein [Acidobacteriota bacterium]